jgi:carboxylesterase
MLHGLGGGVYEMRMLAERLHQQGFTVAAINYPGHDKKANRMPVSNWQAWYQHAEETYLMLRKTHSKVNLVGFSTGCPLALHLAAHYANDLPVHKLVMLSPFFKIRQHWYLPVKAERLVNPLTRCIPNIPRLTLPIKDPHMRKLAQQAAYFQTFNTACVGSALELIGLVKPQLHSIQAPMLIIQSRQDQVVCPSGAELLLNEIASAEKRLIWLEESDHIIVLDCERTLVIESVLQFAGYPAVLQKT